ncbi:MAG: response regulator [Bacteroidota bacterium]
MDESLEKRILLVEDDEVNIFIAEQVFSIEGLKIDKVLNGEAATKAVNDQVYDLILMDVEMPIMGGIEATEIIRKMENGKHVPIIALTAHSISDKLEELTTAGMTDFLIKPFNTKSAQKVISQYLK